jgi:hypothetical protein
MYLYKYVILLSGEKVFEVRIAKNIKIKVIHRRIRKKQSHKTQAGV